MPKRVRERAPQAAAAATSDEYEKVPLEGGGYKRRRVGASANAWQYMCEHGRRRSECKECGYVPKKCEHGRQRKQCKECGGSSICEHGRQRSQCKECGYVPKMCEHGR